MGGGELPDRVPGEEVGLDAPALEQAVERDLEGEERGLGEAGPVEELGLGRARRGEEELGEGPIEMGVELGADRVEGRGEGREGRSQSSSPMPARWAPWPVKRKARLARGLGRPRRQQLLASPARSTPRCSRLARVVASE